jgi:hypothetical protein
VPNEIGIEAMIKGLRPGPTTQYFARKPPQTLEKLLQKMDEYIRADNDFRKEGRKHTSFLRWPGALEEEFTLGTSGRSIIPTQMMIEKVNLKGSNTTASHQGHNKASSGHQVQEIERVEALEEDKRPA